MSKNTTIVIWIVIVVVLIGGGIWWWTASQYATPYSPSAANANSGSGSVAVAPSTAPAASYPQGNSDQSINQDMANVNMQMNGLSSDNASVAQSLNDQPVSQAE